jgi:basic amino acid/polyamine antiporter, APA family
MSESQQNLSRRLGFFPVYNIVVANIIGAGIFTTSGLLMGSLGNVTVMISLWVLGGIIALCGALSYSELGAAMPKAGGEYIFLSNLFHPSVGFLSGWVSFIAGFSAPIAASAIGFSEYFYRAYPQIAEIPLFGEWLTPEGIKKVLAVAVILLFTGIHTRGLSLGAKIQNILTILKIGLLVALIVAGFTLGKGDWANFTQHQPFDFNLTGWKTAGLSLLWIMFAYSGWNAATYIGSEVKNPGRNIPRALIYGTLSVMIIYFLLNIFFVYAVSPADMQGVVSIGGLAVGNAFGSRADTVVSLLISFALFSSLSAYLILGPRVYYAMSKDGFFFKSISKVATKSKVPVRAILLQAALSLVMVVSGTFDQILTYMGFALGIFPILAVLGVFRLRKRSKDHLRMPGFPVAQIVFLLASGGMLLLSFFERPVESGIALGTVLLGFPAYWYFWKNKS